MPYSHHLGALNTTAS